MERKQIIPNTEIEKFALEIDAIYSDAKSKVGMEDLEHIKSIADLSKTLEQTGRTLIHVSSDPVTWGVGVLALGYHYLLEFTELGHNILHGQYDSIPGNTEVTSTNWIWDNTMDEEDWKFEHHMVHHPFTNIIGKDNDFGFLVYRASAEQKWRLYHLFQLPLITLQPLVNTFFFPWYVATSRALSESRDVYSLQTYLPALKKLTEHFFKNYILYPLMPGASYSKVALGNFLAKLFQNTYLEMILAISHLHKEAYTFPDSDGETKGEYYLRQILSTCNFESDRDTIYHIVYGGINTHIEHHLFPDLPPNRLREVAPKVKAVCDKYSIPYRNGSFFGQFFEVIQNVIIHSFPIEPSDNGDIFSLFQRPAVLFDRIKKGTERMFSIFNQDEYSIFSESKILHIEKLISGDAISVSLKVPTDWEVASWKEGSYISIQLNVNGKKVIRQYSLTKPSLVSDELHITIKKVKNGLFSNFVIENLKVGDKLKIIGKPKGDFHLIESNLQKVFIVAGVGITPILSMIEKLNFDKNLKSATLIYFNIAPEKTLYKNELESFSKKGLNVKFYFDFLNKENEKENFKEEKFSKKIFESLDLTNSEFYICAPESMIEETRSILKDFSVKKENILSEKFSATKILKTKERESITHKLILAKSNKEVMINENTTLLEAIESCGIEITSGCRQGLCKSCQVQKRSGVHETNEIEYAIQNRITTCNAVAKSDLILDI